MVHSHLNPIGVGSATYTGGRHRPMATTKSIGLIPLGDRDRVKPNEIVLVGTAEEVDSVDPYTRFLK